jgi:hypothetical protein
MVRDGGLGHADAIAYLLLSESTFIQQSPQRACLLHGIQIAPLKIFRQRDHQSSSVRALRDDAGNLPQLEKLGRHETRSPATMSKALASTCLTTKGSMIPTDAIEATSSNMDSSWPNAADLEPEPLRNKAVSMILKHGSGVHVA